MKKKFNEYGNIKVNYRSNDEGNYCLMPNFTHIFGNPSKKKKKKAQGIWKYVLT